MAEAEALHALLPFLRNWVWEHGRVGTRYLDCTTGEVRFDEGKKAHFAREAHVYISLFKDAEPAAQAAPTLHEGGLARLLRAAQHGRPADAGSPAEVQRAVQDCVELALVSAYQRDAEQARARYAQEPMFDNEIRAAVVDDVRRIWVDVRERLARYDFTIFHGFPQPLLISDAPFIDWRVRAKPALPFVSLPLGPYSLLVGTPSARTSRSAPLLWEDAPTGQRQLMIALAREPARSPYAEDYRAAHDLPSVATVQTALRALARKEIAGRDEDGSHAIVEPFLAEWVNREQRDASVGAHLQQGA